MVKILINKKIVRRISLQKFDRLLHAFKLEFNEELNIWELVKN